MVVGLRRTRPWRWIALGLVLGAITTLALLREPADQLTAEGLREARRTWEAKKPSAYTVEIETKGDLVGRHTVEVRNGEVVRMTTGDVKASRSAWRYWTVEGLFGFLETELRNSARAELIYGLGVESVVLRVRFDREWGFPAFFLRHVVGKQRGIEWRVLRFGATE